MHPWARRSRLLLQVCVHTQLYIVTGHQHFWCSPSREKGGGGSGTSSVLRVSLLCQPAPLTPPCTKQMVQGGTNNILTDSHTLLASVWCAGTHLSLGVTCVTRSATTPTGQGLQHHRSLTHAPNKADTHCVIYQALYYISLLFCSLPTRSHIGRTTGEGACLLPLGALCLSLTILLL